MGYDRRSMTVTVYVSRHNSEQDEIDDALFDDMVERIREIINDPKYADLGPNSD